MHEFKVGQMVMYDMTNMGGVGVVVAVTGDMLCIDRGDGTLFPVPADKCARAAPAVYVHPVSFTNIQDAYGPPVSFPVEVSSPEVSFTQTTASAKPFKSDHFREDLARAFGLASDAPDEVLLATATKCWRVCATVADRELKKVRELRAELSDSVRNRTRLADRCGDLERENRVLRDRLGEALVGEKLFERK